MDVTGKMIDRSDTTFVKQIGQGSVLWSGGPLSGGVKRDADDTAIRRQHQPTTTANGLAFQIHRVVQEKAEKNTCEVDKDSV